MRTKLVILLLAFGLSATFAQSDFKLSLKQYSMEPDYKKEQVHILEIKNTSKETQTFTLEAKNSQCKSNRAQKTSDLEHQFLFNNLRSKEANTIVVKPQSVFEFSIKISKSSRARLGSVNCMKVTAKSIGKKPKEESIIITSRIPDPNNAN